MNNNVNNRAQVVRVHTANLITTTRNLSFDTVATENKQPPLKRYLVKYIFQMGVADPKSVAIPLTIWVHE